MAVAALYDIHGNLAALDAVLAEALAAGAREFIVGGDVTLGPQPREVLDRLRALARSFPVAFLRGNCEEALLAAVSGDPERIRQWVPPQALDSVRWCAARLDAGSLREFERWLLTLRRAIPGIGDVLFCHATPRHCNEVFTRLTDEAKLRPVFDPARADLVVCGHTHMQFDRNVGATRVVNAGSVGMPFGHPGAYWLLLGPRLEMRRAEPDSTAVAAAVRSVGYPRPEVFLAPPSEEEILAAFARAELA